MKQLLAILAISVAVYGKVHAQQENPFSNLLNATWISEGKQLGGHEGKTVKEFAIGLDGSLIKVKTYTTDPTTLEFGLRNEGVRFFNKGEDRWEFYEFDKLGSVTIGTVIIEEKNLHYRYEYEGYLLQDSWIFVSKDEYQYRVCSLKGDSCDQVYYHEGRFLRKEN